jgi:hypothetical protein
VGQQQATAYREGTTTTTTTTSLAAGNPLKP